MYTRSRRLYRDQSKFHITFPVLILSSFSIAEFCAESLQVCTSNAIQECFNICAVLKVWLCNCVSSLAGSTGLLAALVTSLRAISGAKGAAPHGQLTLSCRLEAAQGP